MNKQFEIKITGSGTLEDIYTSIFELQRSLAEYVEHGFGNKSTRTFEDPILFCEITESE